MKIRFTGKALDTVSYGGEKMPMVIDGVKPLGCDWVKEFPEDGRAVIYQRSHWEEVPEKQWRDVTAKCQVKDGTVYHGEIPAAFAEGFRFRKVRYADCGAHGGKYEYHDAFIVEKSE